MNSPINVLKQLQDALDDRYSSFQSKQRDLSDFIEHDLNKLIEALEQQESDHAEQIAYLHDELDGFEQLLLNFEYEGATANG